jgi:hypothetical protein
VTDSSQHLVYRHTYSDKRWDSLAGQAKRF